MMESYLAHGHTGMRASRRERCRRMLNSLCWQSSQLLAALTDLTVLIIDVSTDIPFDAVDTVTGLVLAAFCVDLALRAYTYRWMLLGRPWAWFDFSVVGISVILFITAVAAEASERAVSSQRVSTGLRGLIVALRWLRAMRAALALIRTSTAGQKAARQATGENKRRYVDLEAGFDLDLVYVRPRLIAMSVPATGLTAWYRNPLPEVARFFESRHRQDTYLVVNACPELPYPTEAFASGEVCVFMCMYRYVYVPAPSCPIRRRPSHRERSYGMCMYVYVCACICVYMCLRLA